MRMYEILKAKTLIFLLFFSSKINKISRYFHIFKMCKMQAAITNTRMEDRKGERTQMCQSLQCMCICMCILIQKIIQRVGVFNELSTSFSLPLTQIRRQIRDLNKTLGSFSFQAAIHQSFSTTALLKFGGHFLFFGGGSLVHCRILSLQHPGLYLLDAISTPHQKCFQALPNVPWTGWGDRNQLRTTAIY